MNFTAPSVLWALPAAAVPLILHLLSLRRARRVAFPDLSLVRRIHASALPRTRLRSWLLVAARCLLIALLVLAYAGPVLESPPGAGGAGGLDVIVLLDSSYSMGRLTQGKSRFELAAKAGASLVRRLKDSDRVAAAVFSDGIETPAGRLEWTSKEETLKVLAEARTGFRGTDYRKALAAAYELLGRTKSKKRRIVLLLSDGARHGFPGSGSLPAPEPDVTLLGLKWAGKGVNAFVSSGGASPRSTLKNPRLAVRVASDSGAGSAAEPRSVAVFLEGRRVASASVKPASGRALTVSFPLPQAPNLFAGGPGPRSRPEAERPGSQQEMRGRPGERSRRAPSSSMRTVPLLSYYRKGAAAWSGRVGLRPDALSLDDAYFLSFRHERA